MVGMAGPMVMPGASAMAMRVVSVIRRHPVTLPKAEREVEPRVLVFAAALTPRA